MTEKQQTWVDRLTDEAILGVAAKKQLYFDGVYVFRGYRLDMDDPADRDMHYRLAAMLNRGRIGHTGDGHTLVPADHPDLWSNRSRTRQPKPTSQEVHVTPPTQNATPARGIDAMHNTAVLKRMLADISGVLQRGTETINSLNGRTGTLVGQVADAGEFAVATEQTDRSKQALDETAAVGAAMDQHLGGMSTAVSAAEDSVIAAIGGLRVVDEAEDDLAQAGAGPKSVAPARDGA